jgi:hypothetical protein
MYVPAGSSAVSAPDGDIVNTAVCPVDMFVAMTVHSAHTSSAPESTVNSRNLLEMLTAEDLSGSVETQLVTQDR